MSTDIDRLAAARPAPAETTDLVGPEERQALLDRIMRTDRSAAAASRRRHTPASLPVASRRRLGLVAVPTAAAGVAVVVAMAVAAGPQPSAGGGGRAIGAATGTAGAADGSATPGTVAYVLARARTALTDTRELVQHMVVRSFRGCSSEMWTYLGGAAGPPQNRYRETCGEAPSQDVSTRLLPGRPGRALSTYVKHFERTWSRQVVSVEADPALSFGAESSPRQLRQQLDDGQWQLVGRQQIGGRATLHLRGVGWPGGPQPQVWVDDSSFLVVRTLVVKGGPGQWVPLQKDFAWLRTTPATMADFEVRVPPGYARTDG